MHIDLPLDLLRTFMAVAELGSVTRAADRVGRTQPAVTLQLRRLEALFDRPLFLRERRRLRLSPGGEALVDHARRLLEINDAAISAMANEPLAGPVRVGMVQDFADSLLAGVLARFARAHPQVRLEIQVGGSANLRRLLADNRLDMALCVAQPREDALFSTPMRWLGDPQLAAADPIPLAMLDAPCAFRDAALLALERADRRWRMVVTSPSVSGLRAAVAAGLGLTVRPAFALGPGVSDIPEDKVPALPMVGFVLIADADCNPAARHLSVLMSDSLRSS